MQASGFSAQILSRISCTELAAGYGLVTGGVGMELVTSFTMFLTFERTFAILSAGVWLVSLQIGSLGRSAQILSRIVCMAAAGELEAGVEYVGIATHVPAIEIWPAGHPVTGDMFPPRYDVNGGLGVDVFGVAAGAGVLTLTARFMGLGFGVLTLTVRPRETVLWGCSVTENSL